MTATPSNQVKDLIEHEDFEEALELFKKLNLSDKPTELLLLIKTGKFYQALKSIDKDEKNFLFESSYCLYRIGKYDEALEMLCRIKKHERKDLILRAQILYRLGKYGEATLIYKSLIGEEGGARNEEKNLLANYEACLAGLAWSTGQQPEGLVGNKSPSYDVLFNKGTTLMATDQEDALILLKGALATAQKEPNVDPDDLAFINAQLDLINNPSSAPPLSKRLSKKLPIFQKQLIIEKQIIAGFENKKFHSVYNLWKKHNAVLNLERVYPLVQVSILKCKRLKNVSIRNLDNLQKGELNLDELNNQIYPS